MKTFYLHQYNFIRLIVPWMTGVFCGDWLFDGKPDIRWSLAFFCLFSALVFITYFLKRHSLRWCFGVSLFGLCFMGGWIGINWQLEQSTYDFPPEETVYRALLVDKPEQKERSYLCRVFLKEQKDSVVNRSVNRQAILYLAQDSLAAQLKGGEEILLSARISPPANGRNFDEFDYARYLMRKGVSGTGYVGSGRWKQLLAGVDNNSTGINNDTATDRSFRQIAVSYREKVLSLYRRLGFEGDELAVLSALTIGEKTELSESIRESYSVSGASHVLALSGLHIGLLYTLFFFLLKPFTERWWFGRCLRSLVMLLFLWVFAFFTGFSPSVVRSVSMFSVLALADLFGRTPLSLNTLAIAAFLMLLCNPVWLFDVGFQLSFLAVAAILLVQQPIYNLIPVKNRVGKYVWSLMSVSLAAQLGTAPLVLLYFSRFSTHFLLTNLVVIPLVTVILYLAVLMLLLTPLPVVQEGVAWGVNLLLKTLNNFTRWVEHLPYSSLDGIWLYKTEVLGIYVFFLFVLYYLMARRARRLLLCLSCLFILCTFHTVKRWQGHPRRSLVFYNVRNCPVVHCIEADGSSWLNYGNHSADKKRLKRVAANYWRRYGLQEPREPGAPVAGCQDAAISVRQQIISFHHCRVCMVSDNRWKNKRTDSPLPIQYLYLCKGYDGSLKELTGIFKPSCILLDASLPEYRKQAFRNECKQSGICFVSLSEEGSVQFLL